MIRVFPSGDVKVKVNGKTWTFNPQCLEPAPGETPPGTKQGLNPSSSNKECTKLYIYII